MTKTATTRRLGVSYTRVAVSTYSTKVYVMFECASQESDDARVLCS